MTDHTEEAVSASNSGITALDKAKFGIQLMESTIAEATQLLKLYFGLQTGAVVLLLKVMTDVHARFVVRAPLAISVLLFGASAIICLKLLETFAEIRSAMLQAWANEANWAVMFESKMKEIKDKTRTRGKVMDWLFRFAIIFASLFVLAMLLTG
jgi:hypothetical protein